MNQYYGYVYLITLPESSCSQKLGVTPYYFGQKSSSTFDDRYWGSGFILHKWYRAHGANANSDQSPEKMKELGVKQYVIAWARDKDELNKLEAFFVDPVLGTTGCLNLKGGGSNGKHSQMSRKKQSETRRANPEKVGKGTRYFNNGVITVKAKEQPEGFVLGAVYDAFNKGWISVTNGKENRFISPDSGISNGFWRGRTQRLTVKKFWFTNEVDEIWAEKCPEGWHRGRVVEANNKGRMCYTNGSENGYFDECPDGWWHGMAKKDIFVKKWWTNGEINILQKECPEGFYSGMTKVLTDEGRSRLSASMKKSSTGRRHWTNGAKNIFSKECPGDGFYLGITYKSEESKLRRDVGLKAGRERSRHKINSEEQFLFN
jgi:hypothetical protein